MKIVINDANILIDIIELGLVSQFFALDFNFVTTSLVFDELELEQQLSLKELISHGVLKVRTMSKEQLLEIHNIQKSKPSLSFQDCSAFLQADLENGTLLTSDNVLRKFAKANNLEVHGHLWIFDHMIKAKLISAKFAIKKLNQLRFEINSNLGLPKKECEERINNWKLE